MSRDRAADIERELQDYNDFICVNINNEQCDGIMEYDAKFDTWTCDQCGIEMTADDIMEEVEEQEAEMWIV